MPELPPLLPTAAVDAALRDLPAFARNADGHLRAAWRFPDFAQAFAFLTGVAALAEQQGHHPEFGGGWGRAWVELWTHDAGGITRLDLELATAIARIAPR